MCIDHKGHNTTLHGYYKLTLSTVFCCSLSTLNSPWVQFSVAEGHLELTLSTVLCCRVSTLNSPWVQFCVAECPPWIHSIWVSEEQNLSYPYPKITSSDLQIMSFLDTTYIQKYSPFHETLPKSSLQMHWLGKVLWNGGYLQKYINSINSQVKCFCIFF